MKLPRHGGRTACLVLLLAIVSLGCTSTRFARLARRPVADFAALPQTASTEEEAPGLARTTRAASLESETPSPVMLVAAPDATAGPTSVSATASTLKPISDVNQSTVATNSYSLDLSSVLGLADGQNPQVILARERINEAYAQVDRADVLWMPSLRTGLNYNKHEGAIQDVAGNVFNTNRGALYGGWGAGAVGAASPAVPGVAANFHLTDAIFQPKIARYQASSRQFAATSARNDVLCDSAIAYLELLRAERRLAIAHEAREKTNRVAELTGAYARTGQGSQADHDRLLTELAARDNDSAQAEEAVQTASARLAFLIHADPSVAISTNEPFVAPLNFTAPETSAQELVAQGLSRRPELAEHRQLVGEACERLRREQYAPLIPSVLLGLSYGGFGGGLGSSIVSSDDRFDADALAYWEIRNLGFGEQAVRCEAESRLKQAQWRQVIVLDRIAQEVVEAHVQVESRRKRIEVAKPGIVAAERSFDLNLQRIENAKGLPIEVLQSVQALAQARRDYLNAVVDYNVAQIRLCRATGWFEDVEPPTQQ